MNRNRHDNPRKNQLQVPLFASPWMALFFVLRQELAQPRPAK
jgi:hypothetical protein